MHLSVEAAIHPAGLSGLPSIHWDRVTLNCSAPGGSSSPGRPPRRLRDQMVLLQERNSGTSLYPQMVLMQPPEAGDRQIISPSS